MIKNKIIIAILCLLFLACESQTDNKLIGKWEGQRKETLSGRKYLNNGRINKELSVYEFTDKSTVIDQTDAPELATYTYSLKDSILCFAKVCYKILKLTDTELVLQDYNPKDPENILVFKRYYTKSKILN
jgi:hypothetical protein